jgi:hypothetical protein
MRAGRCSRVFAFLALLLGPATLACSGAPPPSPVVEVAPVTAQPPVEVEPAAVPENAGTAASGGVAGDAEAAGSAESPGSARMAVKRTPPPPSRPAGSGGPDADRDGIPDAADKCPGEPEDVDGFQDPDGCPDMDNDMDGIVDAQDQCPNDPETMNGFQDQDGCPDAAVKKKP